MESRKGRALDSDRSVRQPAVGQSWRYAKHALVEGTLVDTELVQVSAVGRIIELQTHSEAGASAGATYPAWGTNWLRKYGALAEPADALPSEVHNPWGMALVDSQWDSPQAYEKPIPLWPAVIRPGWSSGTIITRYQTGREDPLTWQLTMAAHGWESITVPAGHFNALRYTNLIYFRYSNVSERNDGRRRESFWFAPEIGRWARRESSGSFYQDIGTETEEAGYRWELLGWT